MVLDHIGFAAFDFSRSPASHNAALTPFGVAATERGEGWAMLGRDEGPRFWFGVHRAPPAWTHLDLYAPRRAQVRPFRTAALVAGERDNGAPGLRPRYRLDNHRAFVTDLNGHNIEAVRHTPEG